jgi:hypothetical protein
LIPRFFEIEAETNADGEFVAFIYSKLRKNRSYIKAYTLWFRLVATVAIPFFLMLFFNLRILIYYRKNRQKPSVLNKFLKPNYKFVIFAQMF